MKRLYFILLLITAFTYCHATNLTIDDLQRIFSVKEWNSANQILAKKKWYYNRREEDQYSVCHEYSYVWAYDNSNYSKSADGWLTVTMSNYGKGEVTLIDYQLFDVEGYADAMSSLDKNGYKLIKTETDNSNDRERIISTYSNNLFILEAIISKESYTYDGEEWVPGYWVGGYTTEYDYYSGQYKRVWTDQKEYVNGRYQTVQQKGYITRYVFDLKKVGGIYDKFNGLKYTVYENGNKENECMLKDGIIIGTYKTYYTIGKLARTIKILKDSWIIEEYKQNGEIFSKFTVPIHDEQLKFPCNYTFVGEGFFSRPLDRFGYLFDDKTEKFSYKIEGTFIVKIFTPSMSDNCPSVMFLDEKDDSPNSTYTYTEYEYNNKKILLSKTITNHDANKENYTTYDASGRIIEKGQTHDEKQQGELLEREYSDSGVLIEEKRTIYEDDILNGLSVVKKYSADGALLKEQQTNYSDGELDGIDIVTEYLPKGIKKVESNSYKNGELDGYCYKESFINGKRQLDSYETYVKGKLDGEVMGSSNDSVAYAWYKDGTMQRLRIFHDGMMRYRSPHYVSTDTTNLTLITELTFTNEKVSGIGKFYYPGYFSDTIKMIKGKHAGELQFTKDFDNGVETVFSRFGTLYNDSTYEKIFFEVHSNPATKKKDGLSTFKDSVDNYIYVTNYKDDLLDGLSKFYQVSFCDGEYWAYFDKGIWTKSRYHDREGKLIEIQKLSLSQVAVLSFTKAGELARKDFYLVNTKTISGFNNCDWVNIFAANDTYKTGEYYIYDDQERVVTYRKKDSNFIVHNNYDQKVTYWVHHANAVPEKFYELNTQDVMSGTIVLNNGDTSEIIKVKKGYRDGVTKIINNQTGKTIQKVKYTKGVAK